MTFTGFTINNLLRSNSARKPNKASWTFGFSKACPPSVWTTLTLGVETDEPMGRIAVTRPPEEDVSD